MPHVSLTLFFMFSGVRRLLSGSYLFFVGVDGILGVVLCCLLWMVCLRVGFCHSLFGLLLLGGRFRLRSPCGLDTFLNFIFFNYADVKVTF